MWLSAFFSLKGFFPPFDSPPPSSPPIHSSLSLPFLKRRQRSLLLLLLLLFSPFKRVAHDESQAGREKAISHKKLRISYLNFAKKNFVNVFIWFFFGRNECKARVHLRKTPLPCTPSPSLPHPPKKKKYVLRALGYRHKKVFFLLSRREI